MLCKQCGFDLGSRANFCPSCGYKITEDDRKGISKNPAIWLKALLGVILAGLAAIFLMILFSDNMTETISEQLKAVKENRMTEAYYGYTSKLFREATSLDRFKEFMKDYPVFSDNESVRFIDRNAEHDRGSLHAMIMTAQGNEIPVQYRMVKEDDKWLIESIKMEDNNPSAKKKSDNVKANKKDVFDAKPLEAAIQDQMQLIRKRDLKKAYDDFTSDDFQKTTNFKEFEEFVKVNPNFSDNVSLKMNDLTFDNNIATMTGVMTGQDGRTYAVEYDLIQEKGKWKIFHVKFSKALNKTNNGSMFSKFVVGSVLNEDGLVSDPKTILKADSEDIYLSLFLHGIKAGTEIQVVFEHVDTHSTIPAVIKRISEDGDVILTFIFSPPASGWPKGNYRLLATSSTGESSSYDFKLEE